MHWASRYVGIPFKWNGYDFDGAFCYGLLWLVLKNEFGINIPKYPGSHKRAAKGVEYARRYTRGHTPLLGNHWEPGDFLHMKGDRAAGHPPLHVGVCLGGTKVLHVEPGTASCIIDVARIAHRWRPIQGYRPCDMT